MCAIFLIKWHIADTIQTETVQPPACDPPTGMSTILAQLRGNDTRHPSARSSESDTRQTGTRHTSSNTAQNSDTEMQRIKKELEAARSVITRQEQELAESRTLKHTMEQAMGPPSEADFPTYPQTADSRSVFNASALPFTARSDSSWTVVDDVRSDQSRTSFSNTIPYDTNALKGAQVYGREHRLSSPGHNTMYGGPISPMDFGFGNRTFSGSSATNFGIDERILGDYTAVGGQYPRVRRNTNQLRINPGLTGPISPVLSAGMNMGFNGQNNQYAPYHERNYAAPVSPVSPEFPPLAGQAMIPVRRHMLKTNEPKTRANTH